jgi:hypothetical protein
MHFAGRTHRKIKFGLSINANDEGLGDEDDLPSLQKIENAEKTYPVSNLPSRTPFVMPIFKCCRTVDLWS